MSRRAFVVGLVLSPLIAGTYVAVAAGPFFAPEPPAVAGEPYSAVAKTESVTVFSDGNRVVRTNTVRLFRDAQGRTRTERSVWAGSTAQIGATQITISDPVSGQRYIVNPQMKTVFVMRMRTGSAPEPAATESLDVTAPFALLGFGMGIGATPAFTEAAAATTSLGQKVINGLTVTGTRLVRTIPAGTLGNEKPITSTLEQWVSADLGIPVLITQKSSIGGQLTLKVDQVVRAQPDAALFTPPSDYARRQLGFTTASAAPAAAVSSVTAVKNAEH